MMSNMDPTIQMLVLILIGAVAILFVLIIVYAILKIKEKKQEDKENGKSEKTKTSKSPSTSESQGLGKRSIFDFMEFDKIEDNMIIQKNGKRFIMAIQCQGINYDLMSEVEKTGVEEGFVQFLNTLRFPIQLYIQTRTVNLENSLNAYNKRVSQIESKLLKMTQEYEQMRSEGTYDDKQLNKAFYEITKQRNLYEYGKDIIADTEKMSKNKSILTKKYYIILAYSPTEEGSIDEYDKSEVQGMAFNELYTRAQSLIRAISSCGVNGKILNSVELGELLYVAYNRDESETFELKKAALARFDALYSTAPDVLQKRIAELDKEIERKAVDKVEGQVEKYKSKYREEVTQKENSIDELADEMAKLILNENREYLGNDMVNDILTEEYSDKGGQAKDEKKKQKTRTRTAE